MALYLVLGGLITGDIKVDSRNTTPLMNEYAKHISGIETVPYTSTATGVSHRYYDDMRIGPSNLESSRHFLEFLGVERVMIPEGFAVALETKCWCNCWLMGKPGINLGQMDGLLGTKLGSHHFVLG